MPHTARDRLIVALDVPSPDEASALVRRLGDNVRFYKVGLELVLAGGLGLVGDLQRQGKRVFLDMKLLDIGHTVERAAAAAAEQGVAFLTVHGHDLKTLRAAVAGRAGSKLKLLAVTVLTNLTVEDLRQQGTDIAPAALVVQRARLAREAGFDGVIASGQEAAAVRAATAADFLIVTPGIRLAGGTTDDQQRIMSPAHAIAAGADHLVVGRPITLADDPPAMAEAVVRQIGEALRSRQRT